MFSGHTYFYFLDDRFQKDFKNTNRETKLLKRIQKQNFIKKKPHNSLKKLQKN